MAVISADRFGLFKKFYKIEKFKEELICKKIWLKLKFMHVINYFRRMLGQIILVEEKSFVIFLNFDAMLLFFFVQTRMGSAAGYVTSLRASH